MAHLLLIGSLVAALLAPAAPVSPQDTPTSPLDAVTIKASTANGTGCPAKQATDQTPAEQTITVTTDPKYPGMTSIGYPKEFTARSGGSATTNDSRKSCTVALDVQVPEGYTFGLQQVDNSGFATVAAGVRAQVRTRMYFQGLAATAYVAHTIAGPVDDAWKYTDATDLTSLVFKPCGENRYLLLQTEVFLNGTPTTAKAASSISLEQTKLDKAGLVLRRCTIA